MGPKLERGRRARCKTPTIAVRAGPDCTEQERLPYTACGKTDATRGVSAKSEEQIPTRKEC